MVGSFRIVISSKEERLCGFRILLPGECDLFVSGLQERCRSTCDSSRLRRFFKIPALRLVAAGSTTFGENVTGGVATSHLASGFSSWETFRFKIDTGTDCRESDVFVRLGRDSSLVEGCGFRDGSASVAEGVFEIGRVLLAVC